MTKLDKAWEGWLQTPTEAAAQGLWREMTRWANGAHKRFSGRYDPSWAEDATAQGWEKLKSVDPAKGSFTGWFNSLCVHRLMREHHHQELISRSLVPWVLPGDGDGEADGYEALGATPLYVFNLTPRQKRLANLMAEGRSVKEIAAELGVCPGSVSSHLIPELREAFGLSRKSNGQPQRVKGKRAAKRRYRQRQKLCGQLPNTGVEALGASETPSPEALKPASACV